MSDAPYPAAEFVGSRNCDTCRENFDCKTLSTVLTIMKRHHGKIEEPRLMERYDALLHAIEASNWHFPNGARLCRLANDSAKVRALTADLLELWKESEAATRFAAVDNLYQEEARHE